MANPKGKCPQGDYRGINHLNEMGGARWPVKDSGRDEA